MLNHSLYAASSREIGRLLWARRAAGLFAVITALYLVFAVAVFKAQALAPSAVALAASMMAWGALHEWLLSRKRQFIREARMPVAVLHNALFSAHPNLSGREADLVVQGLRQFFVAAARSGRAEVGMPSKVVDTAWRAFIAHDRAYAQWCDLAFGSKLRHTPAQLLGANAQRNDSLRRTWFWACRAEGIDPRDPSRLPLLFALDSKLKVEGGLRYVPQRKAAPASQSHVPPTGDDTHCAIDFSRPSAGFSGDAEGLGGSDSSGSGGDGDSGGD